MKSVDMTFDIVDDPFECRSQACAAPKLTGRLRRSRPCTQDGLVHTLDALGSLRPFPARRPGPFEVSAGGMMPVATRSVLTVVFLAVGGYCLLRCALAETGPGGHRRVHLLSDVAQLGMGVGMLAMLWRPVGDRWGVQLA